MHMARMADPSFGPKGYSLASLTKTYEKHILAVKREIVQFLETGTNDEAVKRNLQKYRELFLDANIKTSMKKLFARPKMLKNGPSSKMLEMPTVIDLHTQSQTVREWVTYSTLDSEVTFYLREALNRILLGLPASFEGTNISSLFDLYNQYWIPFGEILTDMERVGIRVNTKYLAEIEEKAKEDMVSHKNKFLEWVNSVQDGLTEFNPSSTQQLQQLLFAPFERKGSPKPQPVQEQPTLDQAELAEMEVLEEMEEDEDEEEKMQLFTRTLKVQEKFPIEKSFKVLNTSGLIEEGKTQAKKFREMTIKGLGIPSLVLTATGLPSVDTTVLRTLCGIDPAKGKFGKAFDFYREKGQPEFGKELCLALDHLLSLRAIETLIQTFILPLQESADENSRIHCSFNINTETGRLSSRRPNLQNQPALEKDRYKIRNAFEASPGNKLIIADYGQLELRILAHVTKCKSMIEAFEKGGDFHSRTCIGMYPKIKEELEAGKLLLEPTGKGKSDLPLLKDKYAAERRKAKTMNFSIAYGKSAMGFAKDWGCSIEEANDSLKAWYQERPEVLEWQEGVKEIAVEKGWTRTLMGRYRNLTKHFKSGNRFKYLHALRAAINTPIQGGAADIVIAAMVKIHQSQELKRLNWKTIHQIHDEVILVKNQHEHSFSSYLALGLPFLSLISLGPIYFPDPVGFEFSIMLLFPFFSVSSLIFPFF